jgi:hypothetical protein
MMCADRAMTSCCTHARILLLFLLIQDVASRVGFIAFCGVEGLDASVLNAATWASSCSGRAESCTPV